MRRSAAAVLFLLIGCSPSNEDKAGEAVREIVKAQKAHHSETGTYTPEIDELATLPVDIRTATAAKPYHGYHFVFVDRNGAGPMDYATEFVVCAVPGAYKESGTRTFAAGPRGIVLQKDNGGRPAENATDFVGKGWSTRP